MEPEAASTPVRFGQVLGELEVRRQIRGQNELGDAVAGLDGADCVTVIVQRDEDFAPVVRINDADFIGRGQALLTGQAAAGVDQPGKACGNLQGDAGGGGRPSGRGDGHQVSGRRKDPPRPRWRRYSAAALRRYAGILHGAFACFFPLFFIGPKHDMPGLFCFAQVDQALVF